MNQRAPQGVTASTRTPPVIVSLTTGPARLGRVHRVVESLLRQTFRPDRLVLWLSPEKWGGTLPVLPRRLRRLFSRGLEVRVCPEGSFDELAPVRELAQRAVVILADDDRVYPREWLATLCQSPAQVRPPRRLRNGPFLPPDDGIWQKIRRGLVDAPPLAPAKERGTAGIVTAAGSGIQLVNACLAVRQLRRLGCRLPVELYHTASEAIPASVRRAFPGGTRFVEIAEPGVSRYGIKPWSLWATPFERCLWIDADNLPLRDPTFIVEEDACALAWPDLFRWNHPSVYQVFPELPACEPEFETGQLAINSIEAAPALWRAILLNREFKDYIHVHMFGDKDTFRLALRMSGLAYRWADTRVSSAGRWDHKEDAQRWTSLGLLQHYPPQAPLFLHRTTAEWDPLDPPPAVNAAGSRAPPYPRGRSWREQPERTTPAPAEVLEAESWVHEELPELLFFLREMPVRRLRDRLRVRWRMLGQPKRSLAA